MNYQEFIDMTMIGSATQLGLKDKDFTDPGILFSVANAKKWDVANVEKLFFCLLERRNFHPEYQNDQGNTFFHELVYNKISSKDLLKLLYDVCNSVPNFNVNLQNNEGDTFLHAMLKTDIMYLKDIQPVLELALAMGYRLKIRNNDDKTIRDLILEIQDVTKDLSKYLFGVSLKKKPIEIPNWQWEMDEKELELFDFFTNVEKTKKKSGVKFHNQK